MKTKAVILTLLAIAISIFASAQIETNNAGARSAGIGNTSTIIRDTWAVFNNPAATCRLSKISAGLYYENRFLLKQTGYGALAFQMPVHKAGNISVGISHYGYKYYQYSRATIGYSQQLFTNLYMGLNINYLHLSQAEYYGRANGMTFELGLYSQPVKNFAIGLYVFNPVNVSFFENRDLKMPVTMKLGLSYLFSDALLLAVETGKSINGYTPIFKGGIEYTLRKHFSFRAGISMLPIEYSVGLGYKFAGATFDLAFAYHQILGLSPKISVQYEF